MTIGEKIKELRKKNHITQEKLAQYLNISCQAVSKWESNIALPDITYVIPISNFFGIGIDTLFDINPKTLSDEEPIITEKFQGLRESRKYAEAIEFMKSECNKYPRNYLFKSHLAEALRYNWSGNEEDTQLKECIELCERILNDCTDNDVRYPTMQQLFLAYRSVKNNEKARKIAEALPNTPVCRDLLLEYVLSGEELDELLDSNLDHFMFYIWLKLQKTAKPKNERTIEDRIRAQKTAIQLYQLVYYDDKLGWYSNRIAENYINLVKIYAEVKDTQAVLDALTNAFKYAQDYNKSFSQEVITASIFRHNKNTGTNYLAEVRRDRLLLKIGELIKSEELDFVKGSKIFEELKTSLEIIAEPVEV